MWRHAVCTTSRPNRRLYPWVLSFCWIPCAKSRHGTLNCNSPLHSRPLFTSDASILVWAIGNVVKQKLIRIWDNVKVAVMWDMTGCGIETSWRDRKNYTLRFTNIHSAWSYKCTPSTVNVFWKRYNADWPFRGEPSSDQAVPTAAMCSVWGSASKCLVTGIARRRLASW